MSSIATVERFLLDKRVVMIALIFLVGGLLQPLSLGYTKFSFLIPWYELDRSICFTGVAVVYLLFGKKDLFCLVAVLFVATCCLSTYVNGGDAVTNFKNWAPCIAFVLAAAAASRNYFRELLWATFVVTFALCVLNLASMVVYPNGVFGTATMVQSDCFFFGHRNSSFKLFLPALACSVALDCLNEKKISACTIATIAVSAALVLVKFSATSFIALVLFVVGFAFIYARQIRGVLNGFTYLALYLVAFFAIIVFRAQDHLGDLFALLGKNATFTGRTVIWDTVLAFLSDPDHRLLGYGAQFTGGFQAGGFYTGSAHNTVLQVLMIGGWAALVLLAALVAIACLRSFQGREQRLFACLSLSFGCMLVIGLTENICTVSFFMVLALMVYMPLNVGVDTGEVEAASSCGDNGGAPKFQC